MWTVMERVGRKANAEICPTCPRCGSSYTKFCYYNNYSLTQPRYFCKGCRRYWTKGGSLRKTRRSSSSSSINKPRATATHDRDSSAHNVLLQSKGCFGSAAANPSLPGSTDHAASNNNNIDLALVYANFLNHADHDHQPESNNVVVVGPPSSTFEFSSVETDHRHQSSLQITGRLSTSDRHLGAAEQESSSFVLPDHDHQQSSAEAQYLNDGNAFYLRGLDSIEKQQVLVMDHHHHMFGHVMNQSSSIINYTNLPPLPGELETLVSEGMVWPTSESDLIMFPSSQTLHATHTDQSSSARRLSPQPQDCHPNQRLDDNGISPFRHFKLCHIFRP